MKESKETQVAKQHKKDVDRLGIYEEHLIDLISETENEKLITAFELWQNQRAKCNDGFKKFMETILKTKNQSDEN